jgi:hypothetical protein
MFGLLATFAAWRLALAAPQMLSVYTTDFWSNDKTSSPGAQPAGSPCLDQNLAATIFVAGIAIPVCSPSRSSLPIIEPLAESNRVSVVIVR